MKGRGPWWDILLTARLEKVQVVGAQSPTVAESADTSTNGMVSKVVTLLH